MARKNIIIMLMSIELMLLAVNFQLITFSVFLDDLIGQMFSLFILTVAAAESATGLAILVIYYRVTGTIAVEQVRLMKGVVIHYSFVSTSSQSFGKLVSRCSGMKWEPFSGFQSSV